MRFLAVILSSALVVTAQQPAATNAPAAASSGATASMSPVLTDTTAPWVGSNIWMRRTFQAPDTKVTLGGPVRLKDYVVDGKLTLSLRNYLELVVANNTDIAVQRLNLELPKNAIQRAFGIFDPTMTSSFNATRATTPATSQLQGANVLSTLNQPFQARVQELLPYSTTVYSQFSWTKASTNDTFALFNPSFTQQWQTGFTQPLLRGRGPYVTKLPITIARASRRVTELSTESTIQSLIVNAENFYWDVISARERLKVQEQALSLADQTLKRAQQEIELGATSKLEIYQPQQNYATAEINLVQVKFQLQAAEDILRRQIGADLDTDARKLPIMLTEDVKPSTEEQMPEKESLVQTAMANRPDLLSQQATVDVNDLQIKNAINNLKPLFNLTGSYQTYGRGGPGYSRSGLGGDPVYIPGSAIDAMSQMFGFNYNTFSFGLTLNLPLRDRANTANLSDAVVNKKVSALRQRSIEQQVRQDVLTALTNVENSRASVKLAQIALDFAQKRADADKLRYDLGVINLFFLLATQNDLTVAQSNVVNQAVTYRRNLLTLQQRLGTILKDKGIVVQ